MRRLDFEHQHLAYHVAKVMFGQKENDASEAQDTIQHRGARPPVGTPPQGKKVSGGALLSMMGKRTM